MSTAFESDLVPGTTPEPAVGSVRFYIADVQGTTVRPRGSFLSEVPQTGTKRFGTLEDLRSEAMSARPKLFSDDLSALPLFLKLDCEYASTMEPSAFFTALSIATLPVPGHGKADYTASITIPRAEGDICLSPVTFTRRDVMWATLFTPLGLIPVPGSSVIPRHSETILNVNGHYVERAQKLTNAVCIEAVVKGLGQCDMATVRALHEHRKARIQSLALDGKPCWGFVRFCYSKLATGGSSGPRDAAVLSVYTTPPSHSVVPAETVTVARRGTDGRWRPCTGYLRKSQTLTAASVLLESGMPCRAVLRVVEEPELDDFIDLLPAPNDQEYAANMRWSNGVLLQVRNRSIPRLVRERSATELVDVVTRIEKAVLPLAEQVDKCKDRAQQIVEQGKGDPAPAREMAILCTQRIEVFKAILATLRQEAARKKP